MIPMKSGFSKRLFDILVSLTWLVILILPFLIIGLAIKLEDKGPVFFRHRRVGQGGVPFYLLKFRSMKVLRAAQEGLFEPGNTSRITKVGRFLRKTKIDELPQLINVLRGEMSIVGPRPEVQRWVDVYPERWARVLTVKPGITDKASITYMNEESVLSKAEDPEEVYRDKILPHKLELCEEYVSNRSFSEDMMVIFSTVSLILAKMFRTSR